MSGKPDDYERVPTARREDGRQRHEAAVADVLHVVDLPLSHQDRHRQAILLFATLYLWFC